MSNRKEWHMVRNWIRGGYRGALQCGPLLSTKMRATKVSLGRMTVFTAIGWVQVFPDEENFKMHYSWSIPGHEQCPPIENIRNHLHRLAHNGGHEIDYFTVKHTKTDVVFIGVCK